MKEEVAIAALSPHPPIIIPEVGRGEESSARSTIRAMDELGEIFREASVETLVIITPHGPVFSDAVSVRRQKVLRGDFRDFGASEVRFEAPCDIELVDAIVKQAATSFKVPAVALDERALTRHGLSERLDHGVLVPLYYLRKHGVTAKLVVVNIGFLPLVDLYCFGMCITRAANAIGRRVGIVASGDLSHRLKPGAPAGYNPRGEVFDREIVDSLSRFSVSDIIFMPSDLVEAAGECGLRPISMMLGGLDGAAVESRILSYEGPFGVGYGVAVLRPVEWSPNYERLETLKKQRAQRIAGIRENESFPVSLARKAVEFYVRTGTVITAPSDAPEEFRRRAGAFVSIHKDGLLRGCIGTTEGTRQDLVHEIIYNAIAAATEDPRFPPVTEDELPYLDYSVDVLSEPVPVHDMSELDPRKYGVICEKGNRRGLLLPDLPGIDTVEEQISIARRKAGISPSETGVKLYRFTVTRYH